MEVNFKKARWQTDGEGTWLCLLTDNPNRVIKFCREIVDKLYTAVIKLFRPGRSNNANSYFWTLAGKLASAMQTSNDEMYIQLLERYGVFTHIVVKSNAVEQLKRECRLMRELGEVTVNNTTGTQLQCFFGSSTYDTEQMSRLINGTVSECKEQGIETRTPEEIERLCTLWGENV